MTSPTNEFKAVVAKLNTCELAGAYKALHECKAPMHCLSFILDQIIDKEGVDYAESLIEERTEADAFPF